VSTDPERWWRIEAVCQAVCRGRGENERSANPRTARLVPIVSNKQRDRNTSLARLRQLLSRKERRDENRSKSIWVGTFVSFVVSW